MTRGETDRALERGEGVRDVGPIDVTLSRANDRRHKRQLVQVSRSDPVIVKVQPSGNNTRRRHLFGRITGSGAELDDEDNDSQP